MELAENKYFNDFMFKYFLCLIESELYSTRKNDVFINTESSDNKSHGIYNAMKDLTELGESVVCYNFDNSYTIDILDNINFIRKYNMYNSIIPCDILVIFSIVDNYSTIKNLIDYYNPKYIFYC